MPLLWTVFEGKSAQMVEKKYLYCKCDIIEDFANTGSAIPGYFHLIKYYSFFALCILAINSVYPIYATYYACNHYQNPDPNDEFECLQVGLLYYVDFNNMITALKEQGQDSMVEVNSFIFRCSWFSNRQLSICSFSPTTSAFSISLFSMPLPAGKSEKSRILKLGFVLFFIIWTNVMPKIYKHFCKVRATKMYILSKQWTYSK